MSWPNVCLPLWKHLIQSMPLSPAHTGVPKPGDDPIHIHTRRRHLVQPAISARLTVVANKKKEDIFSIIRSNFIGEYCIISAPNVFLAFNCPGLPTPEHCHITV